MSLVTFPSKISSEVISLSFNFLGSLQFGESINGANVTVVVSSGVDPNPSAMLAGGPTFTANIASQDITGGVEGVIYTIVCTVTGTNSHTYVQTGQLAVIKSSNNYVSE